MNKLVKNRYNNSLKALLAASLLIIVVIGFTAFRKPADSVASNTNLRCELRTNPLGIDAKTPRLSWEISTEEHNQVQTAYQLLVASSPAKLAANEGDLWNSGKVISNQSVYVAYKGQALVSKRDYYWKVKTWVNGNELPWSEPAYFSTGLLNATDWKGKWIGLDRAFPWDSVTKFARLSARYFRKTTTLPKQVKKATVYVAGLGLYELYINGQRVGDQVLAPSPTEYDKEIKYNTYDVTSLVKKGDNAIGTVLGNGRFFTMRQNYKPQKWHTFGYPKMLLQLEIVYTDGSSQTITTDNSWKVTADGPIRTNNEYDGEEYDATKEMPGWANTTFDDRKWLTAQLVKAPGGKLEAQMNESMKVMEQLKPRSVKQLKEDVYILDMGQNMAGWMKMNVTGSRGQTVTLRFAESLQPDGSLYIANLRDAIVTDRYTLRGDGKQETWSPHFVFHGFRYVEVTGYPGKPNIEDFTGEVIYDAMPTIGHFQTSNALINQIHQNAYWGIRSNYKGMPIDCPQRNERQPWLGDRATGAYGESFLFENEKLYAKWLDDIETAQTAEGSIPDVAPNFWYYYKDNMTWPGTYLMIANMLYHQFGDAQPIKKHYASMKKWLAYMRRKYMVNGIVTKDSYGDWCVPPESPELIHSKDSSRITDPQLLATSYYYYFLQMMQQFAQIAGQQKDMNQYAQEAQEIALAFNAKFYHPQTNSYSNNTVTANLLPLAFGLVQDRDKEKLFQNIVAKIMVENSGHISTGVIGTQWLMRWLTMYGRADIAWRLATNDDYPSWGYMVKNGATTIWELWNGNTANPSMNSQNHVMLLGDLLVWFYENIAGIKSDPAHPGFERIIMKPSFINGLESVTASYQSVHGLIKSSWKKEGAQLSWQVTIPANTKAQIYFPAAGDGMVQEGGKKITELEGVRYLKEEDGRAVYELGSGSYSFSVAYNNTVLK